MDFIFDINDDITFNFDKSDYTDFEISNIPEKEYIEKEPEPCMISFSVTPIYADVVSVVFRKEEEDDLINGN